MEQHDARTIDRLEDGVEDDRVERPRRWRLVPPAITPIALRDVCSGLLDSIRRKARDGFQRDMEAFFDADTSATYTSYRRALASCVHELRANTPDECREVLIPAFCSPDFPETIEGVGLEAARYDVDPTTLAANPSAIEAAVTEHTLAVVAVNVLGYTSPMETLAEMCSDQDVFLIEALGYAPGTEYKGQRLGTFGDCAVLNFQQGKPIPVGGGMILSQNPDLAFSDQGRSRTRANVGAITGYALLSRPRRYYAYTRAKEWLDRFGRLNWRPTTHPESKFAVEYDPPFATMSDFQGAIASRVFDRLEDNREQRAKTAQFYTEALSTCPKVRSIDPIGGLTRHQYVRFPLIAETQPLRDRIGQALNEAGIQATTLYDWPMIDPTSFPGAGKLQRHILTLPTHPYVDERDRRLVVETIRTAVARDTTDTHSG